MPKRPCEHRLTCECPNRPVYEAEIDPYAEEEFPDRDPYDVWWERADALDYAKDSDPHEVFGFILGR